MPVHALRGPQILLQQLDSTGVAHLSHSTHHVCPARSPKYYRGTHHTPQGVDADGALDLHTVPFHNCTLSCHVVPCRAVLCLTNREDPSKPRVWFCLCTALHKGLMPTMSICRALLMQGFWLWPQYLLLQPHPADSR